VTARLECAVEVDAPPQVVWDLLVDWERQGEWILLTRVRGARGTGSAGGQGVGVRVEAFTGIGPVGFLDTMVVTAWEPPWRCLVQHTGRVVKGPGAFLVEPLPRGRSRFVWCDDVELPLGLLGRLGWIVVEPLMRAGFEASLRRFARLAAVEARR
jgi:Polyketide cyclase / dehydrase and lipid transport